MTIPHLGIWLTAAAAIMQADANEAPEQTVCIKLRAGLSSVKRVKMLKNEIVAQLCTPEAQVCCSCPWVLPV